MLFVAMRLADGINAVTGLWVVPRNLPEETLGAVLPLMQVGAVLALPTSVLATVFTRQFCVYVTTGKGDLACALLRDVILISAFVFVLVWGFLVWVMPVLCVYLRIPLSSAGYWAAGCALLAAFVPMLSAALQAAKRFAALALGVLLAAPIRLVTLGVLLPIVGLSGYFIGQVGALAVTAGVACLGLWSFWRGSAWVSWGAWRADCSGMRRYTLGVALGVLTAAVQGTVLAFVIRNRLPENVSAGYYMISRFADMATYCGTTLATVLFPYAVEARLQGRSSAALRNSVLLAIVLMGGLLAVVLQVSLPLLFAYFPAYTIYQSFTSQVAFLTVITTLQVAAATYFSHAMARDDFSWLCYAVPVAGGLAVGLLLMSNPTLSRVLWFSFAAASIQCLCVGVEIIWRSRVTGLLK